MLKIINLKLQSCGMVSASTEKPIREINKITFKEVLLRSVLLSMNEQIDDQPDSRTADGYKHTWNY